MHLSNSEKECLKLWANGYTIKEIGKERLISPRTVETHLNRIKEKTGLNYKNELIKSWNKNFLV